MTTQLEQYSYEAQCHTLAITGSPELLARLQGDVHKLLAAYERNSGRADIKRAAALAANRITIKRGV